MAIDTDTPTISFGGAAADGTWVSGTPTVVVTGGEQNTSTGQAEILSGISSIACTVDRPPVATPPLDSGYATSFELTANGANHISCIPTTAAGTSGRPFTETVEVDNPANDCSGSCNLTVYGSSQLIDDGADPIFQRSVSDDLVSDGSAGHDHRESASGTGAGRVDLMLRCALRHLAGEQPER